MADQNSTERLREEILVEAQKKGEEIILRAQQEAENLLKNFTSEADRLRQSILDQARAEAARQSDLILATVPVETGRLRAARIESLLESIREEAYQQLLNHEGFPYRETIVSLALYAISQMEGDAFVVRLFGPEENLMDEGLAEEIIRQADRPVKINIVYQQETTGGGVIVEDATGRQVWDNRLFERLKRLWPELRRQIALDAGFVPKRGKGGESP
jgi:vacuolar-type H+-ATPase subunit E/Vma4